MTREGRVEEGRDSVRAAGCGGILRLVFTRGERAR